MNQSLPIFIFRFCFTSEETSVPTLWVMKWSLDCATDSFSIPADLKRIDSSTKTKKISPWIASENWRAAITVSLLSHNYTCKERDHRPTAYGKVWKRKSCPWHVWCRSAERSKCSLVKAGSTRGGHWQARRDHASQSARPSKCWDSKLGGRARMGKRASATKNTGRDLDSRSWIRN